jgi:hypothetical protein
LIKAHKRFRRLYRPLTLHLTPLTHLCVQGSLASFQALLSLL